MTLPESVTTVSYIHHLLKSFRPLIKTSVVTFYQWRSQIAMGTSAKYSNGHLSYSITFIIMTYQ